MSHGQRRECEIPKNCESQVVHSKNERRDSQFGRPFLFREVWLRLRLLDNKHGNFGGSQHGEADGAEHATQGTESA